MRSLFNHLARAVSRNATFRRAAGWSRDRKQRLALRSFNDLNAFERRVLSQNGEDGILAELFSRLPHNRFFVEIGVEDGLQCNTALLATRYGWRGVMIEADEPMFDRLKAKYAGSSVTCVRKFADRDNVAATLEELGVPRSFDLLSIDIDGNDYYVWEATAAFTPSVVVIEYNATLGPGASKVITYNPAHIWRKDRYYGASLTALAKLGTRLGYSLIGTDRRGINAFFVRHDLLGACGFPQKAAHDAWRPNPLINLLPSGSGTFFEP